MPQLTPEQLKKLPPAPSGVWTVWIDPPAPERGRFRERCNVMHPDTSGVLTMFEFDVGQDPKKPTRYNIVDPSLVYVLMQQKQHASPHPKSPHWKRNESPDVFIIMDSVEAKKQANRDHFHAMLGTSARPVAVGGAPTIEEEAQNPGDVIMMLLERVKQLEAAVQSAGVAPVAAPIEEALGEAPEPVLAVGRRVDEIDAPPERVPDKPVTVTTAGEMSLEEMERATAPSGSPPRTGKR